MNKSVDITNVVLKTDNLLLRAFKLEDVNDFYLYAKVDGVGQMAGWEPHTSIEESLEIIHEFIKNKNTFAILKDNIVIGSIGIETYDEERYPEFNELLGVELGYVLSKEYWGKGYMVEAVKKVISYLFLNEGIDIILCGNFIENLQSKRVKEKCGFKAYTTTICLTQTGLIKESEISILKKMKS